jgi:hypothetical protein
MTARFVLVCDVCGAITDDHYPYPVDRARKLARSLGFRYRKLATTSGDYRASEASYHRVWLDVCPECMYVVPGLDREPVQLADWRSKWHKHGEDPQPMHAVEPEPHVRHADIVVTYEYGEGPYRLYTAVAQALRGHGVSRAPMERLRREMFAPGADFVQVAARWVTVTTEEQDETPDQG